MAVVIQRFPYWLVFVLLVVFGSAASQAQNPAVPSAAAAPVDPDSVAELIDRAEASQHKAAELRAEWLATAGLIKQARQEAALGHFDAAADLAELARLQGDLAAAQAERESDAWRARVIH